MQAGRANGESRGAGTDSKSQYDKCSISDFTQGPILGTGSFGRVLLASHKQTGKICAIKALSKAHLVRNQQASRHRRPACLQNSPFHVQTMKGIFACDGRPQVVSGGSMSACILTWKCCMQVAHLKAERDVLRLVCHPGLVNYLGGFQDGTCVYFIMEYVSGGEFFRHLKMRGK